MTIEYLLTNFSYIAIFLFLILNGILGFPSSQLIYLFAGYFIFKEKLSIQLVLFFGIFGHFLGNYILYELSRKKGIKYIIKFAKYFNLKYINQKEIKKVQLVMKKKGLWFLFFGKLVNPIKLVINIPCGISRINRIYFNIIILITSSIWAIIFVYLGFIFGKSFNFAIYYGIIMIILASIIMFIFYKYMNSESILKQL